MASTLQSQVEHAFTYIQTGLLAGDLSVIGIVVATLVGLLTIVLLLCNQSKGTKRGVLLIGLCDSGKTLLFTRLTNGRFVETHTSIKENTGIYKLGGEKSGSLKLIDIPGHERLRLTSMENFKPLARAIIVVIDSVAFQKEIKDVANLMYEVLTDKTVASSKPPVLIACNKQDQTLAKGSKIICTQLEKELNTVRKTQAAALHTGDNTKNVFLGKKDVDFKFSDLKHVEFVECAMYGQSQKDGECNLEEIHKWLLKVA